MATDRSPKGIFVVALLALLIGAGAFRHAVQASMPEDASGQIEELQQKVEELTARVDEVETKLNERD